MMHPSNFSVSEKYRLLKIIQKVSPTKWEDIAHCYGWVGNHCSCQDKNTFLKYIMTGIQTLKAERFVSVNILDLVFLYPLKLTRKGKFFLVWYPISKCVYWIFSVGIVSAAAIATLWPIIADLFKE